MQNPVTRNTKTLLCLSDDRLQPRPCSFERSGCGFSGCCHEHRICLDVCLCALALVFFVCIWPWHEGAGRIGQRGAGWCQLASGHMVQSHHIGITGRFWLDSDTLPLILLSVSHPPSSLSSTTALSLSASLCLYVDLCSGNASEPIRRSFKNYPTN